jgi:hypothetical protein
MNKTITLRGYYGLVLAFIWDTFHYNIPGRISSGYDYWVYLRDVNYSYTLVVLNLLALYLLLVKFRVKITVDCSFV